MKNAIFPILSGFCTGLIISACISTEPDVDHCARADGESVCATRYKGARPYCTIPSCDPSGEGHGGCVVDEPTSECNYACGGDQNILEDNSCLDVGDGDPGDGDGDTGDGDGEPTGDGDGDMPCEGHGDCTDPEAPFCDPDSGECVDCDGIEESDLACAEANASTPVCLDGSCVQCVEGKEDACGGVTPICDVGASMCVGCSDHGQCPDSACNLFDGNCFDPGTVVHVHGDVNANCSPSGGTPEMPFCTIAQALSAAGSEVVIILHDIGNDYTATNAILKKVVIFPAPGETPSIRGNSGDVAFDVTPAGQLLMRGIAVAGTLNGGGGLSVSGSLWIDDCIVGSNSGQGISINGGTATIRRSKIVNNTGGGIVVQGGGNLVLENSFVGGPQNQRIINIIDGQAMVLYSTVGAGFGNTSRAIACMAGAEAVVRNSIVVSYSGQPEVDCPGVQLITSFTEAGSGTSFDDLSGWFADFEGGDFLLSGNHPAGINTAATWQTGDPATDIEGDPRPTTDGPDFAGADVIP